MQQQNDFTEEKRTESNDDNSCMHLSIAYFMTLNTGHQKLTKYNETMYPLLLKKDVKMLNGF